MKQDLPADLERALHIGWQFAQVHAEDNDVLGRMAREYQAYVRDNHTAIVEKPHDE